MNTIYEKVLKFKDSKSYISATESLNAAEVRFVFNNNAMAVAFETEQEFEFGLRAIKLNRDQPIWEFLEILDIGGR